MIVLSWIISPLATIGASAATVSGSPTLFSGYGYGKSDEYIHNITRLDSPSEDSPSVTILVHGQGGEASHWSNDTNYDFAYDPSSLIETLRSIAPNSEVLWARMKNKTQFYLTRLERGNYNLDVKRSIDSFSTERFLCGDFFCFTSAFRGFNIFLNICKSVTLNEKRFRNTSLMFVDKKQTVWGGGIFLVVFENTHIAFVYR